MKVLKFCVYFPLNVCLFTACTVIEWAVEMFNLPFELWDELK